uniref:CC domain-containing protein n=1 Tax=Plectus sambesii TaxID=2011161 RepID=A0A914X5M8_9BILA
MQLFLAVIAVAVVLCGAQVSNPCPGVGSRYIGFSVGGSCPAGTTNVKNFCCTLPTTACPGGATSVGACTGQPCPTGFACNTATNQCCPSTTTPTAACVSPIGTCYYGECPVGFACDTATNQCCQSTTEVGTTKPTPKPTTSCPASFASIGPCVGGLCPPGNTCVNNNICCSTG